MIKITGDTYCYYCGMIKLLCLHLVYYFCVSVITLDILVTGLHLPLPVYNDNIMNRCYFESNSGCIHSSDGGMRYKVRVSLGLSHRCTNLINPLLSFYNCFAHIFFTWLPHYMLVCACTHYTIFYICFLIRIYRYTCDCLCTPLVLGCFLTTPEPACSDFAWNVVGPSVKLICVTKAWWISDRSPVALFFHPLLTGSRDSIFAAREHLSVLLFCKFLCKSYFCTIWWCNIYVILDHVLW